VTTTPATEPDKGESEDRSATVAAFTQRRAHDGVALTADVTGTSVTLFVECPSRRNGVIEVGKDQTWDVLALADREEADEVTDLTGADPLNFKWGAALAQ